MSDEITEPTVHLCWSDFAIRGAVHALRMANLEDMADDMEAQLKPAVDEPIAFASVVKDRSGELWVRLGAAVQSLPWGSGQALRNWGQLDVVEVLRVGIGEPKRTWMVHPGELLEVVRQGFAQLKSEAITAPEKRTCDDALALVAALLGES